MTASNPISDLLAAPLGPNWTVESLADRALDLAAQGSDTQEFVLDADSIADPQSRRLLRPLLACFATRAADAGTLPNLYGGDFAFERQSPEGPVWILGQFSNRPGNVRVTLRRSSSPPVESNKERTGAATDTANGTTLSEFTILLEQIGIVKVRGYRLQRVAPKGAGETSWLGVLAAPGEEDVYAALFPGTQLIAAFRGEIRQAEPNKID